SPLSDERRADPTRPAASQVRRTPGQDLELSRSLIRTDADREGEREMEILGTILLSEIAGTAMLTLMGGGVVANAILGKTKGNGGGWLLINFGWGLAVFAGVWTAFMTGAHINPAVTFGLLMSDAAEDAPGIPNTLGTTFSYVAAELIGAFLDAFLAWLVYKNHYDQETDPGTILGTFSTGPEIRSYGWNLVTEIIATFVLIFVIIMFGNTPHQLGPLAVALLVLAIGASLGGPTGYAINPARDLGPRLAHAILPIKNKGGSDWGYSWVPIVGPMIGAGLAGLASIIYF